MSADLTIARPYARAAFELARTSGSLEDWARKLALAASIASDPRVRGLIGDPHLRTDDLAGLFLPEGEPADGNFAGFVGALATNRRLPLLPAMNELFAELKREHEKVLRVTVRSAVAIEPEQEQSLRAALKKRFDRDIELHTQLDPSVIGGAVIDAGDVVIDASVRGRLERLSNALID